MVEAMLYRLPCPLYIPSATPGRYGTSALFVPTKHEGISPLSNRQYAYGDDVCAYEYGVPTWNAPIACVADVISRNTCESVSFAPDAHLAAHATSHNVGLNFPS